ncbi:DUF4288 domain-containing protein [Brevibacillus invocatus]|uniref:DUF4288 domain-containing protein n=1 Tax=Brevibacillus invocatus TaxID=173959 RepID=A0A3M8BXE4_9BACL|nr:DUF4288 domain-containing protein [Brevibacillus invocatus]RNB68019.1 DUF4288 domain-containing protein [Brevibacillus invocatus]
METNSRPPQTKWYAVKVLFESVHSGGSDHQKNENNDGNNIKLFEESIILVKETNMEKAIEIAEKFAKKAEHESLNSFGETVKHQFVRQLHTFELNDDEITIGTEIYSRFIHASNENSAIDVIKRYYPEVLGEDGDTE